MDDIGPVDEDSEVLVDGDAEDLTDENGLEMYELSEDGEILHVPVLEYDLNVASLVEESVPVYDEVIDLGTVA